MANIASETEVHIHLAALLSCLVGLVYGVATGGTTLWVTSLLIGVVWLGFIIHRFRFDQDLELTQGRILIGVVFIALVSMLTIVLKVRLEWSSGVSVTIAAITTAFVYWMFFGLEPDQGGTHRT